MLFRTCFLFVFCCAPAWSQAPDTRFFQEVKTFFTHSPGFTHSEGLPGDEVLAITVDSSGVPVAATEQGIVRFTGERWEPLPALNFTVRHLVFCRQQLFACGERELALLSADHWVSLRSLNAPIRSVCCSGIADSLLIASDDQITTVTVNGTGTRIRRAISSAPQGVLSVAQGPNGETAVGTKTGLHIRPRGSRQWTSVLPEDERYRWAPRDGFVLAHNKVSESVSRTEHGRCSPERKGCRGTDSAGRQPAPTVRCGSPPTGARSAGTKNDFATASVSDGRRMT